MPPTYVDDGNVSFAGGQNDGLLGDRIRKDQYLRGVNVTTKNGAISPRPGFVHQQLRVVTSGGFNGRSYKRIFETGKFQAAAPYNTDSGQFIVAVISGIIFLIDPRRLEVSVVPIEDGTDRLNQYRRRVNWSHAGRFLVFFDYPDLPVILDRTEARRSKGVDQTEEVFEVISSAIGTYVQNRLWVASPAHEFTAGDPVGGINQDSPITFEEVFAPAAAFLGQVFSLGSQSANQPITAMGFLQVADTSTGIGPLFIATANSIYLYQANLPRSEWEQTAFGRLVLYNAGIAGARAFTNQNSDLVFLSGDGQVRSLLLGSTEQERWQNTPISREVMPWIDEHAIFGLESLGIVASRGNRIFITVAPYRTRGTSLEGKTVRDFAHGGMIVLELDNVSTIAQEAFPAWAGLWTGISPMEMVNLEDGLYVFSKDDGGVNRLYFLNETISHDIFEGEEVDIVSRVYTREYDFSSPFQDKELGHISYSLSDIKGDLTFVSEYQPAHMDDWFLWRCFKHNAKVEICNAEQECGVSECALPTLNSHSFREMDFGDPKEIACDRLTNEQSNVMRKVGLRLTLKGRHWQLRDIHLRFMAEPETDRPATTQKCEKIVQDKEIQGKIELSDWELHRTAQRTERWPEMNLTL